MNKNYRKGAEDVGKIAAKGFNMIGKEILGHAGELKNFGKLQDQFENKVLDIIDDVDIRLRYKEHGFAPVDYSVIENMCAENKIIFISTLYLLVDADETKSTADYFGLAVVRFGVRQIHDGIVGEMEELLGRLDKAEAELLMRMICEMVAIGSSTIMLSVSDAIIENLLVTDKRKQQIKSEVEKLATGNPEIFIVLLASECPPIADDPGDTAATDDGYEICDKFSNFHGRKVKFVGGEVVFTDRYSVSATSIIFEGCTLIFDSGFSDIVEMTEGDIQFIGCKLVSKQKKDGKAFVLKGTDASLRYCSFENWVSGLLLSMEAGMLSVDECSFLSCESRVFLGDGLTNVSFNKCHIEKQKNQLAIVYTADGNALQVVDTSFADCVYSTSPIFDSNISIAISGAKVARCGFTIASAKEVEYQHCVFDSCTGDLNPILIRTIKFLNCDISNHAGNFGMAFATSTHIVIKSCKLKNIKGSFIAKSFEITNSTFESCVGDTSGNGINIENYLYINDELPFNDFNGMAPTGSLFEIKPSKESHTTSISKCKFIGCKSGGALIAAFSEDKATKVANVSDCEIVNCQCPEGYILGVYVKNRKFYLAPKVVEAWNINIDLYAKEGEKQLLAALKRTLTDGLVKGCSTFHKPPIDYKIEKNIRENVMNGVYDDVLTMYDSSIWSNGKSGVAFGCRAVYFTQTMEANYFIPYEKIAMIKGFTVEHKKQENNYTAALNIELGNGRCIVLTDPSIEKNELMKVLVGIRDVFMVG